ncbi:hypothetical protein WN944_003220 [Citrus x changshan-huyou]|uniref:Uncharacterized protein n=1 Tax=Citrus x changshan-huyou TaxID=2935761 RepID=A0AAP0LY30_9ROSI
MVASRWARLGAKEADGGEERTKAATKVGRSRRVLGGAPLVTAHVAAAGGRFFKRYLSKFGTKILIIIKYMNLMRSSTTRTKGYWTQLKKQRAKYQILQLLMNLVTRFKNKLGEGGYGPVGHIARWTRNSSEETFRHINSRDLNGLMMKISTLHYMANLGVAGFYHRLLDHDPPPPLLLDHDPSPPRLLDHELSPMIFQVMTQVRSALDVWAPLSLPKQLARENFSLNNREKNLILRSV